MTEPADFPPHRTGPWDSRPIRADRWLAGSPEVVVGDVRARADHPLNAGMITRAPLPGVNVDPAPILFGVERNLRVRPVRRLPHRIRDSGQARLSRTTIGPSDTRG
jgi:hypothetical protein